MGCTPSKKELEKQTGEKPGDYPDATDGKHGKQKNGNIKKNNEIKAKAAPVVTLTPNGEGPQVGLRISTFDGIPADIKFIDADEESLLRASMQDISASEAVSGKMDPSREDDSKRKELEDRIESMIEPHVEASVQAAPKDSTPNKSVVVQETVTTVTKEGEDGTVEQRTTVVTTETVNKAGGVDPAEEGAKSEDRFYNNKAFEQPDIDPSNQDQQDAALKIQTQYRKHRATEEVQKRREEVAATKIQAGIRGYHDRKRVKQLREQRESEHASEPVDAAGEVDDIDLNDPEVIDAATKIQAGFKGYKARKEVQEMKKNNPDPPQQPTDGSESAEEIDIDLNDPEVAAAATKIQASFRGYKIRNELKTQQEANQMSQEADQKAESPTEQEQTEEEEPEVYFNDPEAEKAAIRIQASYRGYRTRKSFKAQETQDDEAQEEAVAATVESAAPAEESTDAPAEEPAQPEESAEIMAEESAETKAEESAEAPAEEPAQPVEAEAKAEESAEPAQPTEAPAEESAEAEPAPEAEPSTEAVNDKPQEDKPQEDEEKPKEEEAEPQAEEAAPQAEEVEQTEEPKEDIQPEEAETKESQPEEAEQKETEPEVTEPQAEEVEHKEVRLAVDPNDPEVQAAASKIQAGFRGMHTRRELKRMREPEEEGGEEKPTEAADPPAEAPAADASAEKVDIDLNDPEVQAAAVKIQASVKGYLTRKDLKNKEGKQGGEGEEAPPQE